MKNIIRSALVALSMTVVSLSAFGEGTTDGTISTINAGAGFVYVKGTFSGGNTAAACTSTNFYVLQSTTNAYKDILAALLTAYALKSTVALNVVGCVTPGATQFPNITSMILK